MYSCAVSGMVRIIPSVTADRYNQIRMRLIGTVWLGWSLVAQIVFQPTLSTPSVMGGRLAGAVLLGEAPLTSHDVPGDLQAS